jgi:phosphoribosylaminoimidazole-succinocarboxamide synthase
MAPAALLETNCPDLHLVARGKVIFPKGSSVEYTGPWDILTRKSAQVRDIYAIPDDPTLLLFVATDRVSAFDIVMKNVSDRPRSDEVNGRQRAVGLPLSIGPRLTPPPDLLPQKGIPQKGILLTYLSLFWLSILPVPSHLVTANIDVMPNVVRQYKNQLRGRVMLVRKCEVLKVEAIVRGYLTGIPFFFLSPFPHALGSRRTTTLMETGRAGSAYAEYEKFGTVHGIKLPAGLAESARLAEPLFTPSTKADVGSHDENISPDQRVF